MKVRIKLKLFLLDVLHFQLEVLSFCLHDGASHGPGASECHCSSNLNVTVVGERDIVYKPEKILALKDIDPEERMNWSKRSLTLRIPTVTVPTVPTTVP